MSYLSLTNTGIGSTITTPTLTPQDTTDFAVVVASNPSSPISSPWTQVSGGFFTQQLSTASPISATTSNPGFSNWGSIIATFSTTSAPSQFQQSSNPSGSIPAGTTNLIYSLSHTAGNAILVVYQSNAGFPEVPAGLSVSDTAGNTYSLVGSVTNPAGGTLAEAYLFVAVNIVSGTYTTDVTLANFAGDANLIAYEFDGIAGLPPSVFAQVVPSVIQDGQSATLSWVAENATALTIAEIGSVALIGSMVITPTTSEYFHFHATSGALFADAVAYLEVLGNQAFFTLQKVVLTMKQDRIPVRGEK